MRRFIYVNLAASKSIVNKDQIPGEVFAYDRSRSYVYSGRQPSWSLCYSRSHPEMIKRLMEQEIPEVYDGTVEIMSVAREAGDRTKVAVRSQIQMLKRRTKNEPRLAVPSCHGG